jgi:hypothetical protein
MTERKLYRRIMRRETHQSRSAASVVVLTVLALGAVYAGVEIVLALLGAPALLVSPAAAVAAYSAKRVWLPYAGLGAAIVGVVLVLVAVIPTRRARHGAEHERMAIVVDDRVLAGAVSTTSRLAAGVAPGRVRTSVSRRRALVSVTPTSGIRVDNQGAQTAAEHTLSELSLTPRVRAIVTVSESGVVGS